MSSVIIAGDTSGTVTLAAPAVSGTTTLTLPATTGTVLTSATTQSGLPSNIAGNGPAFSAYNAGQQSINASTDTKVVFNAEDFDTANCFDSSTNYRFTPTVAGYYQFNTNVYQGGAAYSYIWVKFLKNGVAVIEANRISYTGQCEVNGSGLIYLNGSTDYVEVYARSQGAGTTLGASDKQFMNFSGFLARGA